MFENNYKYFLALLLLISLVMTFSACSSNNTDFDPSPNPNDYYTLSINIEGEGQIVPPEGSHDMQADSTVNLSVSPASGYSFVGWSGPDAGDVYSSNDGYIIEMDEDKEIVAEFTEKAAPSGDIINTFYKHNGQITSACFSKNDEFVISSSENSIDSTVKIWKPTTGQLLTNFDEHTYGINDIAVSNNNKIVSASTDNTVKVWEFDKYSGEYNVLKTFIHQDIAVDAVDITSDGTKVVSGTRNGNIIVWDTSDKSIITSFQQHTDRIQEVKFFPHGDKIASCSSDQTIKIWDASSGYLIDSLNQDGLIYTLDISSDGNKIAFGTSQGKMKVWNLYTNNVLTTIQQPRSGIYSVKFSSNDNLIAVGTFSDQKWSGVVKIWDTNKKKVVTEFRKHDNDVNAVDFSSDDSMVVSGSMDSTVKVWE